MCADYRISCGFRADYFLVSGGSRVRTLSLIDITKSFCPNSGHWYWMQLGELVEHGLLVRTMFRWVLVCIG